LRFSSSSSSPRKKNQLQQKQQRTSRIHGGGDDRYQPVVSSAHHNNDDAASSDTTSSKNNNIQDDSLYHDGGGASSSIPATTHINVNNNSNHNRSNYIVTSSSTSASAANDSWDLPANYDGTLSNFLTVNSELVKLESEPCCCPQGAHREVSVMYLDDIGSLDVVLIPIGRDLAQILVMAAIILLIVGGLVFDTEIITKKNGVILTLILAGGFLFLAYLMIYFCFSRYGVSISSKKVSKVSNTFADFLFFGLSTGTFLNNEHKFEFCCSDLDSAQAIVAVIRTAQNERKRLLRMSPDERRDVYGSVGYGMSSAVQSVLGDDDDQDALMD